MLWTIWLIWTSFLLSFISASNIDIQDGGTISLCVKESTTVTCSRSTSLIWLVNNMQIGLPLQTTSVFPPVTVLQTNFSGSSELVMNNVVTSMLKFTAGITLNNTLLVCTGANGAVRSTITLLSDELVPGISEVAVSGAINGRNQTSVTFEWTLSNARTPPTIDIRPSSSINSMTKTLQMIRVNVSIKYNINYSIEIEAANCAGILSSLSTFIRVTCDYLSGFENLNMSGTPEEIYVNGDALRFSCLPGLLPDIDISTTCMSDRRWYPDPAQYKCCSIGNLEDHYMVTTYTLIPVVVIAIGSNGVIVILWYSHYKKKFYWNEKREDKEINSTERGTEEASGEKLIELNVTGANTPNLAL